MSLPICRSCCAKTGRTVLMNSLTKCPDAGLSSRQFLKDSDYISRDEWDFIRNFGSEMYKNYLLMRSLKQDTMCTSKLSQWLRAGTAEKPVPVVPVKTAKKSVKKAKLKVLPSIPFIHNFDFLKKLNYVVGVGAGAGQQSRPLKAQQQRTYVESSGGRPRAAAKIPKIARVASQPMHKLRSNAGPVNAASLPLGHLPGVGRVHANWFGHDIGYKIAPETGAVALDFVTSPTAAFAGQSNEAFVSKVPKEGFRYKTSSKTKVPREVEFVSKHRAFSATPYADEQERNLRYYNDLMRMQSFRQKRADALKYEIAPGTMRGFEPPKHTGEALDGLRYVGYLQRIADSQQSNILTMSGGHGSSGPTKYLTNAGVADQIQSPGTGFRYNTFNGAPTVAHASGIPRSLEHLPDPDSLRYAADPRQNYLHPADGGVDGRKSGFTLQDKTPLTAAPIGVLPQANVKGTVDGLQRAKTGSAGGFSNYRRSNYAPYAAFSGQELCSDLGNMEAYKYLRHFGAPLHGNMTSAARGFRKFKESNYLGRTADLQRDYLVDAAGIFERAMPTKYLQYGGDPRQMEMAGNYKQYRQFGDPRQGANVGTAGLGDAVANQYLKYTQVPSGEFEQSKFPKHLATSRAPRNVSATTAASKYMGNSGENRVRRRRRSGPFAYTKFARYQGQAGAPQQAGIVINLKPSQIVRRGTGFMTREPPRYMRHTVIPRRGDSSGIEADLAYIRDQRLPKQYKTAASGPLMRNKFPINVGRTSGTLPANVGLRNFAARKNKRRPLIPYNQRIRVGSFAGYNFRDPRFSRYARPTRQGAINDLRHAEAAKNIRHFRVPLQRRSYLDYIRDNTYARQPKISRRGPFDYTGIASYEGKMPQHVQANAFGGDPYRMGYIETRGGNIQTHPLGVSRFGKLPAKHLLQYADAGETEEMFDTQRWAAFLAQEQAGYIYDPGYTGHIQPFYSGFRGSANYGLNEFQQYNSALLSAEEQRERERARLHSLNLFYNIINLPDMEMEVLVPEDTTKPYDYHSVAQLPHVEEKKLSLIHVSKLLKGERKKKFHPVVYHEPFDKAKPWTWIQNFPISIPNEVLKRLSAHSLQSLKAWQRQQALMW